MTMPIFTAVFWWTRGCGEPVCAALFIMVVVGVDVADSVSVVEEDVDVDACV